MTTFRLAGPADDAPIRSLLREQGIPTWVEMAIEREPSFFAGADVFGRQWAVLAEEDGDLVGMYTAAVMPAHVDGRPVELGYLGGLRVANRHRRRIRHLREGYASIDALAPPGARPPWWFTVVSRDNAAARRLLEAGLPGLPRYTPLGDYVTLAMPASRGRRRNLWRPASQVDLPRLVAFHNARAAGLQCSPVLDAPTLQRIGLQRVFVHGRDDSLRAVAALWDQRAFKQIVARRYRPSFRRVLPAYNLFARIARRLPLPAEGEALQQSFIAFLALADDALPQGRALIEDLLASCETPVASVGLHADHPLVCALRPLRPLSYPARVYAVGFGDAPATAPLPAQPEAALL